VHGGRFEAAVTRRPNAAFTIRARSGGRTATYHVRCLPRTFPSWTIERHGTPQAQWYVTAPVKPPAGGYVAIFDRNGAPVWWRHVASSSFMPWDAKLLTGRVLAWGENFGNHFGVRSDGAYEERTLDGKLARRVRTNASPTDVHDIQRMRNGHLLTITYRRRDDVDLSARGGRRHASVFDGEVQELTPAGRLVWRWNSRGHVSPSETEPTWWYNEQGETPPPGERGYDLLHVNSVEPDPRLRGAGGDGVIVSARHLNAVFRIERTSGRVDWKLGGSYVPGASLAVVGVPPGDSVFSGQHDARLAGDGTLTVFDNRSRTSDAPAAVRFRIDLATRTATRIERVTNPDVPRSSFGGSARKLPHGNWVVAWGGTRLVTEQTPSGETVLALRFGRKHFTYRVDALPPGRLSAADLRRGMDRIARSHPAPR
jgi:Arylsulfotransferase (ASST)